MTAAASQTWHAEETRQNPQTETNHIFTNTRKLMFKAIGKF